MTLFRLGPTQAFRERVLSSLFSKKGDIGNVENYRGITLLSVVGKLFTSILNKRLNDWAENYNVF